MGNIVKYDEFLIHQILSIFSATHETNYTVYIKLQTIFFVLISLIEAINTLSFRI